MCPKYFLCECVGGYKLFVLNFCLSLKKVKGTFKAAQLGGGCC